MASTALDAFDSDPELVTRIADQFGEGGPPMMTELGLSITAAQPGRVRFDVPVTSHIVHGGGVMCGQSIMGCMDTGMVFVMASLKDGLITPFTTVQLQTSFERAVPADAGTVTFDAFATKPGRSLVFGQIDLYLADGRRAASATTTYMWIA